MSDRVMARSLAVRGNEHVLVVADHESRDLGELFFAAALRHARDVRLIVMPVAERNGAEPPDEVAMAMRAADVCLLPVTRSLTHTHAREAATAAGARIASMPSITYDMAMRTLSVDYAAVARTSERLAARISAAAEIRLTAPGGTDLTLSVHGRDGRADTGLFTEPGAVGNLPAGEAFVAPLEGTAEGVIVIDAEPMFPGAESRKPLTIRVREGSVVEAAGSGAPELERIFAELGDDARNVAEFGIGTNPAARLGTNILESEKVVGTVHIALGNSAHIGGTVDVPFHNDGVIARPTAHADETPLIENGRLPVDPE